VRTSAIITIRPNAEAAVLHDRICRRSSCRRIGRAWLGETEADPAALPHPAPDHTLRTWLVNRAVNAPRNNGPELLEAIAGEA